MTQTLWNRRAKRIAVAGGMLLLFVFSLGAQTPGAEAAIACTPALTKDLTQLKESDDQQLAMLDTFTEDTYDYWKKNGGVGLNLPIVGNVFGASATWDEFRENRKKVFSQHNYSSNTRRTRELLATVTSSVAYREWGRCIATFAASHPGFYLWKIEDDSDVVVIGYKWTSASATAGQAPPRIEVRSEVTGGFVRRAVQSQLFPAGFSLGINEGGTIQVHRTSAGRRVFVTASANGSAAEPVISTFKAVPDGADSLRIISPSTERIIGLVPGIVRSTPDDNNWRCPADGTTLCDPSSKWRAHQTSIVLTGGLGRKVRKPAAECIGITDSTRALIETLKKYQSYFADAVRIMEDGAKNICAFWHIDAAPDGPADTIVVTARTSTAPLQWKASAEAFEPGGTKQDVTIALTTEIGKTFTFSLTPDQKGILIIHTARGTLTVPADSSLSGVITLVKKYPLGNDSQAVNFYTYRLEAESKSVPKRHDR